MRNQRRFTPELKCSVKNSLANRFAPLRSANATTSPPNSCVTGKANMPAGSSVSTLPEAVLTDCIEKPQRLAGQRTLENELVKKALHVASSKWGEKTLRSFTPPTGLKPSRGGVTSSILLLAVPTTSLRRNLLPNHRGRGLSLRTDRGPPSKKPYWIVSELSSKN